MPTPRQPEGFNYSIKDNILLIGGRTGSRGREIRERDGGDNSEAQDMREMRKVGER